MPYISNTKIDYNFISPSFQYTQLQYFCPQIPQQRAGYSTSNHNVPTCPEYSANILGRKSFHTGWSVQIVYPIRFVTETLLRSFEITFGSAVDLRSLS